MKYFVCCLLVCILGKARSVCHEKNCFLLLLHGLLENNNQVYVIINIYFLLSSRGHFVN